MEKIAAAMPAQLSSTAQDMARGKPSEIDHLNGSVARRGRELGVATPVNQALHALVKLVESAARGLRRHARRARQGGEARARRPPSSRRRCANSVWPARALSGAPLTGGVSSDIWRIDTARGPVCAKRALPKLRVAADWQAPIERNLYEARWMQVANAARARLRAEVLGQHPRLGVLVMELPAATHALWKQQLRDGLADVPPRARSAARWRASMPIRRARPSWRRVRQRRDLLRHPPGALPAGHGDSATPTWPVALQALVGRRRRSRARWCTATSARRTSWSVHTGRCFWMPNARVWGDPAFDLAFCLNHLLLKCLWSPAAARAFLRCFDALAAGLSGRRGLGAGRTRWSVAPRALLPGLLLARVDGKSPVEYLTEDAQRDTVRRVARALLIASPCRRLQRRGAGAGAEEIGRMNDTRDPQHPRASRLGQPRPADGGGRGDAARRVDRPCHRAGRRVDRYARGDGAARRRRAFGGLDVQRAVRTSTAKSPPPCAAATAATRPRSTGA